MVSANSRSVKTYRKSTWHDAAIDRGVIGLLTFTPLAFGSVHLWAMSILQIVSFAIFMIWLLKWRSQEMNIAVPRPLLILMLLFLIIVAIQLVPMPIDVLSALSPKSAENYRNATSGIEDHWISISLNKHATLVELLNLIAYMAIFVVVSSHFSTRRRLGKLLRTIIIMGSLLVLIAVLQKAWWNGRIFWFYPIDPQLQNRTTHIWGPYANRNHFAGYLELVIPCAVAYLLYSVEKRKSDLLAPDKGKENRNGSPVFRIVFMILAVGIMSAALFGTLSRGGLFGFFAAIAVFVMMLRSKRSMDRTTLVVVLIAVCMIAVALFTVWDRIEERYEDLVDKGQLMRLQIWSDVKEMIVDYPVIGSGLGTFNRVYPHYQTRYANITFEHAENDYLEIFVETGLVGFVLMISIIGLFIASHVRNWLGSVNRYVTAIGAGTAASCSAIMVHSFTDFNLRVPANALLLAVIAGIAVAVFQIERRIQRDSS